MRQVNVAVWASDEVTRAGLAGLLGTEPGSTDRVGC